MIKKHKSVLLKESIKSLNIIPNGIYIDCTFGGGGHSEKILEKLNSKGKLYAIDKDLKAVKYGEKKIKDNRFKIIHLSFSKLIKYIKKKKMLGLINGIIIDLGISSIQLNDPKRGFSFIKKGPLDMRIDNSNKNNINARQWLSKSNQKSIELVLRKYGEERFSKKIAKLIFNYKKKKDIKNTLELSKIIKNNIFLRKRNKHPATKTFQAIRIFINQELKELKSILNHSLKILKKKGRLTIISFHSLEDKIVKKFINKFSGKISIPNKLPLTEIQINSIRKKKIKIISKIFPSVHEKQKNRSSRSAIMRTIEKK
ncbi:16S rRNA (cytosine(1402)-N(4))-methyltransferase RsmH [Buchnera aphidicola (Taiwanaphis decaspermi)]|uniref:16S rRNA (cytosine(1402)-N(4))-methyltransferase RsmH n=1 Tax=Buchnera aphidicola TaxID=9 RepID=UPI0031B8A0A8